MLFSIKTASAPPDAVRLLVVAALSAGLFIAPSTSPARAAAQDPGAAQQAASNEAAPGQEDTAQEGTAQGDTAQGDTAQGDTAQAAPPAPVPIDPFLLLADTSDGPTTSDFFYFSLATGTEFFARDARRSPENLRVRRLQQNLFRQIGRAADPLARQGEILFLPILQADGSSNSAVFVETSTGYTTFFDDLGRGGELGKLVTLIGRPFGPLASTDANFALVPRRDGSGRTQGVYLYHATSGRGLYLAGLQDLDPDPPVSATEALPQLSGYVSAAPITISEETVSIAVLDHGTGQLQFLDIGNRPEQLTLRVSPLKSFYELFVADSYNPISTRRFHLVPIQNGDDTTVQLFLADVATGQIAVISGLRSPTAQQLNVLPQNIYDALPGGSSDQPRTFSLLAHEETDGTRGIWLADSATRRFVYISNLSNPSGPTLRPVTIQR